MEPPLLHEFNRIRGIPPVEAALFGQTKGALSGAEGAHDGVFSRCSPHGAVFLDAIEEASAPVQIKLLRVLQDRAFSPVGSHEVLRFSGRVVAATSRPLAELRQRGLRNDLYYRLGSDVVTVPPLRARLAEDPSELPGLVRVMVGRVVGDVDEEVVERVMTAIARDLGPSYPWPGNVRELEQCTRRVLLTGSYRGEAAPEDEPDRRDQALLDAAGDVTAKALTERYCHALYDRHGSYEEVARRVGLDRRTVKGYLRPR